MAGRKFYIDPLNGSSANNGLTSAAYAVGNTGPFGSITDILWNGDSDPDTYGGSGDIFYLVASTADYFSTSDGYHSYRFDTSPAAERWGYNVYGNYTSNQFEGYGTLTMIGVNTDLEEDGTTRYQIQWNNDEGLNRSFFTGYFYPFYPVNIEWKTVNASNGGNMYYWTSGGNGPYFINCKFDWTIPASAGSPLFPYTNPSASFKQCEFVGQTTLDCIRIGAQYGQHCSVVGCSFRNWNKPYQFAGSSNTFYGNIIKDCNYGVVYSSGVSNAQHIRNNLLFNITNDAFDLGSGAWTPIITNNLIVDCGGYAFTCSSGYVPNDDVLFKISNNVVQNATSGLYSPDLLASGGGIYMGTTGGGLYGNIENNIEVNGITLSVDDDFNITISMFPQDALLLGDVAPSSGTGFLDTGYTGDRYVEPEQVRAT